MSRNLDRATRRDFSEEKQRWVWEYKDGTQYIIQRRSTTQKPAE